MQARLLPTSANQVTANCNLLCSQAHCTHTSATKVTEYKRKQGNCKQEQTRTQPTTASNCVTKIIAHTSATKVIAHKCKQAWLLQTSANKVTAHNSNQLCNRAHCAHKCHQDHCTYMQARLLQTRANEVTAHNSNQLCNQAHCTHKGPQGH